jgi:hypothetical protein
LLLCQGSSFFLLYDPLYVFFGVENGIEAFWICTVTTAELYEIGIMDLMTPYMCVVSASSILDRIFIVSLIFDLIVTLIAPIIRII